MKYVNSLKSENMRLSGLAENADTTKRWPAVLGAVAFVGAMIWLVPKFSNKRK